MIRRGTLEDTAALAAVDPFGGDRDAEAREGRLWVDADDDGVARGYASLARCDFHGNPYVEFLFVRPEHRRQGVATRLLEAIEHLCRGRRVFISVEAPNAEMRQLLVGRGYAQSGALRGLNDDHGGADEVFYFKDAGGPR
jgi:GNAT superfamily N-acetyltransferase